jgi:DNA primase
MRVPVEFYQQLRDAIPISEIVRRKIALTRKGAEYLGLCPFHHEKSPSFTVNDVKRFYHCFGCNAHGDVIKFIADTEGLIYKNAAIKLAQEKSIPIPKLSKEEEKKYQEADTIYEVMEIANKFFVAQLSDQVRRYLTGRGLSQSTIDKFAIGYAPGGDKLIEFCQKQSIGLELLMKAGLVRKTEEGRIYEIFQQRITFPIKNIYNKIIGFGARTMGAAMPKYLNSPETVIFKKSEVIFAENLSTLPIHRSNYAILVEGYMDVIALHQAGFSQAIASLGTAVTISHLRKLWRTCDEIIICLDGDAAGIKAKSRVIELVLKEVTAEKTISFIELPNNLDPDDFLKQNTPDKFAALIEARTALSQEIWNLETKNKIFVTPEQRAALEEKLASYYTQIENNNLKNKLRYYFKDMVWQNIIQPGRAAAIKTNTGGHKSQNKKGLKLDVQQTYGAKSAGEHLHKAPEYKELEFIEHAICALLIRIILQLPDAKISCENQITFISPLLNDLKDHLLELSQQEPAITQDNLESFVKNAGFYDVYLLLSSPDNVFVAGQIDQKTLEEKYQLVIDWLYKKHYLLMLQKEYIEITQKGDYNITPKLFSYTQEIHKVLSELDQMNQLLQFD